MDDSASISIFNPNIPLNPDVDAVVVIRVVGTVVVYSVLPVDAKAKIILNVYTSVAEVSNANQFHY